MSQIGVVFQGQSSGEVKSGVQISWHEGKIDINWDTHQGFQHIKGQIGVIFQDQSSGEVKSDSSL